MFCNKFYCFNHKIIINLFHLTLKSTACRVTNSVETLLMDKHLRSCVELRGFVINFIVSITNSVETLLTGKGLKSCADPGSQTRYVHILTVRQTRNLTRGKTVTRFKNYYIRVRFIVMLLKLHRG